MKLWKLAAGWILICYVAFPAASQIYLHSDARDAATKALHDHAAALPVPAYFAVQQARLSDIAAREDKALASYLVASRNISMLNIIGPTPSVNGARGKHLASAIGDQLQLTTGTYTLSDRQAHDAMTGPAVQATVERALPFTRTQNANYATAYQGLGGTGKTDCATVMRTPTVPGDPAAAASKYRLLRMTCAALDKRTAILSDCALHYANGRLAETCERIAALQRETGSQVRQQALAGAMKALQERAKRPDTPDATQALRTAIGSITTLGSDDAKYQATLALLGRLLSSDLSTELANAASNAKLKAWTAETKNILVAIGALDAAAATNSAPLDEPSALLIAIAKVQHDLNVVAIDIDEKTQTLALMQQEASALRIQLFYLARAQNRLCTPAPCMNPADSGPAFAEALAYQVQAYDLGLIPYEIERFREIQVMRAAALQTAAKTEADYRALIQPALDELAAYGAGGIKPETLGAFLASVPISAAILGR